MRGPGPGGSGETPVGREAILRAASLGGLIGSSPHEQARIKTGARALWAAAYGVMCLCLRLGCPRPLGALLSAAVEPVLREMISTPADPAEAAAPSRSFAVH